MVHLAHSRNTSVSRSLMAGFACGIVAAVLNAAFNYFYRKASGFTGAALLDPLVIFISFPILFVISGFIFYEMVEYIKRGRLFFTILFLLLMAGGFLLAMNSYEKGMNGLLIGMVLITGILLSFALPFLATHAKIFMDQEQYSESEEF